MSESEQQAGIIIPQDKLSASALNALIEEFVLREGTDYGASEYSLEDKKRQVIAQLQRHRIMILFDPQLENTTLLTVDDIKKLIQRNFQIVGLPEGL